MELFSLLILKSVAISLIVSEDCKQLVGSDPFKPLKNNLLNADQPIPLWGPEFRIKIDILFNTWIKDWGSIFVFGAGNLSIPGCCQIGQRIPALWTNKGSTDQLYLNTHLGSSGSVPFVSELGRYKTGTWYHIVISQFKDQSNDYIFEYKVDGVEKVHTKQYNPLQFQNVKVYSGYPGFDPANVEIRNFDICQLSPAPPTSTTTTTTPHQPQPECEVGGVWKLKKEITVK